MIYLNEELADQIERADWRLALVLRDLQEMMADHGYDLKLTGVERSRARTIEIYEAAGKPVPAASVHEAKPCRGADCVPEPWDPVGGVTELDEAIPQVLEQINSRYRYPRGKKCVIWHAVGGAPHFHIQVPYDELELAP